LREMSRHRAPCFASICFCSSASLTRTPSSSS
jgi:hypothetical protein